MALADPVPTAAPQPKAGRAGADAVPAADCAPASLRFVSDGEPGWRRVGEGAERKVVDGAGREVTDEARLQRIRRLAIPPAWTDVWICADPAGHLQATGRDARGRKQYRYHPEWQTWRSQTKYEQLLAFAQALPRLRLAVQRELERAARHTGAPRREAVIAALVHLLDTTRLRIGNASYARQNRSFGLSTLHNRHARTVGRTLVLRFVGKSGVAHEARVADRRLARLVQRCRDLPGQALFQYVDAEGQVRRIDASEVNAWLAQAGGPGVTAKVFRTWHGSACALEQVLAHCQQDAADETPDGPTDRARPSARAVFEAVADALGNTPAVCRRSYIHPAVLAWAEAVGQAEHRAAVRDWRWTRVPAFARPLAEREQRLVVFLRQAERLRQAAEKVRPTQAAKPTRSAKAAPAGHATTAPEADQPSPTPRRSRMARPTRSSTGASSQRTAKGSSSPSSSAM